MKKRILFSVFCLIACIGTKAAESADTTRVYYINGEQITGFDGTQLVGALVSDYVVSHEEHPSQKGVIVEKHTIATQGKILSISRDLTDITGMLKSDSTKGKLMPQLYHLKQSETVFLVNGKRVKGEDFKKINAQNIKHINMLKSGSEAARKLDKDGKQCNYILIETKE